jgi:hypothetical protein
MTAQSGDGPRTPSGFQSLAVACRDAVTTLDALDPVDAESSRLRRQAVNLQMIFEQWALVPAEAHERREMTDRAWRMLHEVREFLAYRKATSSDA